MKKILLVLLVVVGILVFFNKEDIPLQNKQYTEVKMLQDRLFIFYLQKTKNPNRTFSFRK